MNRTNICIGILGMMSLFAAPVTGEAAATDSLDTKAIEQAIGKPGEMKDDVYKISLPRKDLSVSLNGVQLKPGFALGSWLAFKQAGHVTVVDGDLVLTEHEVGAVFRKLRKEGIQVSALHNHLIGESPKLMFLHIEGKGDAGKMAVSVKEALSLTSTPMEPQIAKATATAMSTASEEADFDAETIQKELGQTGKIKDGVLQIAVPRPESIKLHGAILPPSMGMATALNFQSAGEGKVAATGDFVMVSEDVDGVTKALADHGILVTALHNHLVHGWPDLYFMHFWANDTAEKLAHGLRAGLDAMKKG
ncbi:MAG: DUF1259 domain-containing protein [Nitrospira sp. BO4]|jgi:hypothetical protein|nr:DUF1259 domain-containing protein [Nitrospira sp. BO4]